MDELELQKDTLKGSRGMGIILAMMGLSLFWFFVGLILGRFV